MSTPIPLYVPPTIPLRTKRNFKALALPALETSAPPTPSGPGAEPVPTRPAPAGKRRPPPLGEEDATLPPFIPPPDLPAETPISARRSAMAATLSSTLAKLDLKAVVKFDLRNEDLKNLAELGHGNGGSVMKVEHIPTGTIMAKKIVLIDAKPSVRKQILRELQIMHDCHSEYIISCYGSYLSEPNICTCIEFMDKGSFDGIYKAIGAIDIQVVGRVALAVLEGLTYLYDVHRIIHRDIKPSNILCNSEGKIKLCDFGVSGELINSIANTFVGTSVYMSPERIQGAEYSVKSDVWSLGISLIELAWGRFPFSDTLDDDDDLSDLEPDHPSFSSLEVPTSGDSNSITPTYRTLAFDAKSTTMSPTSRRKSKGVSLHEGGTTMSIIELMHQIVREPAPRLSGGGGSYTKEAEEFVDSCLLKDPEERKTPKVLLTSKWMEAARESDFDLQAWTATF